MRTDDPTYSAVSFMFIKPFKGSCTNNKNSPKNKKTTIICMVETVGVEPTSRNVDCFSVYERSPAYLVSLIFVPAGRPSES